MKEKKNATIYTTEMVEGITLNREWFTDLQNGDVLVKDMFIPDKGRKIDDTINIRIAETKDITQLFIVAFGVRFIPFDINEYGATHVEATPKDTLEVFFDTSKLKICFNDSLLGVIPIEKFVAVGFVYTRMAKWRCKNRLERHYQSIADFYTALADLFIILWDCLTVPKVDTVKPEKPKVKRKAGRKKENSEVKAS